MPAEKIVGRRPPGTAFEVPAALEKLQEHRRLIELPAPRGVLEDAGEERLAPEPSEEVLLVGGLRVGVAGGNHHPLHPEGHHLVEEPPVADRIGVGEEG